MGSWSSKSSIFIFLLLATTTAIATISNLARDQDVTHLHFFFHDVRDGSPNASSAVVVPSLNMSSSNFGQVFVFDNPLTEGPEMSSKLIGRAQGIDFIASLEDRSQLTMQNYVFVEGKYNGSALAVVGRADAMTGVADRTVVGGSGIFRLARGYSIAKVLQWTPAYALVEFDFYVELN